MDKKLDADRFLRIETNYKLMCLHIKRKTRHIQILKNQTYCHLVLITNLRRCAFVNNKDLCQGETQAFRQFQVIHCILTLTENQHKFCYCHLHNSHLFTSKQINENIAKISFHFSSVPKQLKC
jgi:hypothetical protein